MADTLSDYERRTHWSRVFAAMVGGAAAARVLQDLEMEACSEMAWDAVHEMDRSFADSSTSETACLRRGYEAREKETTQLHQQLAEAQSEIATLRAQLQAAREQRC